MARIQDYAIIGDCRTAALISREGSLDWLCWPKFDSPPIFAKLLDSAAGGYWSISPRFPGHSSRAYIKDTNILETHFTTDSGKATLTDLMPVRAEKDKKKLFLPDPEIVRWIRCHSGSVEVEMNFSPRFGYQRTAVALQNKKQLGFHTPFRHCVLWLRSSVAIHHHHADLSSKFTLHANESAYFSLTYAEESPAVLPLLGADAEARIERSVQWWRNWSARCTYPGDYRDAVVRSALTLKLLTFAPSGAIVAAPTTSLPERIGGPLNWDYRYCWLRDSALTSRALFGLGYHDEGEELLTWLLHATRLTHPELKVLYTVYGHSGGKEQELPWPGYENSRPVRIGNDARNQQQLDVYGEVVESAGQFTEAQDGKKRPFDKATEKLLVGIGKQVCKNWDREDDGIWESRWGRRHHTHARLLCWSALDRLIKLSEQGYLRKIPDTLFTEHRASIARQIRERGWSERLQTYVSVLDSAEIDASLLLLSWYEFEKADSERMKSTYSAVKRKLGTGNALLYRYPAPPERAEGAFGICSFWAIEQLASGGGTIEEAKGDFETMLGYANDLGLYAEEIDPRTGDHLGNFPQGFTHVGLISAALAIQERARRDSASRGN